MCDAFRFCRAPKEIIKVKAPLKTKNGVEIAELDMLDILGLFDYLFNTCGLDIANNLVEDYWNHYRSVQADWAMWSDASNQHIPVGIYGDSCKLRPESKMMGVFLSFPLFRPRSIRASRFLIACVQEEVMVGRQTIDCLWRQVVWACNVLFEGTWPHTDINGSRLPIQPGRVPGKYIVPNRRFCVSEIRGDWVFFKDFVLSCKSSWKGGTRLPVCFQCEARSIGDALYYDIAPESHVWTTEYPDVATFLAKQIPNNPSFFSLYG